MNEYVNATAYPSDKYLHNLLFRNQNKVKM